MTRAPFAIIVVTFKRATRRSVMNDRCFRNVISHGERDRERIVIVPLLSSLSLFQDMIGLDEQLDILTRNEQRARSHFATCH